MDVLIIAGMPASGKSTVAKAMREAFGFPILEKDALKEAIFDTMGFRNYAEKRASDHAANAVLLRCAEALLKAGQPMILDNNFDEKSADQLNALLERYECRCVTVFLGDDADAFYRRYVERDRLHLRHLGHVVQEHYPLLPGDSPDHEMTREEFREKFESRGMAEFRCTGARIDVDATDPSAIDINGLIAQIRSLLQE
jgi:predicted kinase